MDDWTKNGVPHVLPDGTTFEQFLPGDLADHFSPFELNNSAPDKWLHNFYNSTGQVYNPETGEFLGFQPGQGDKVGLNGEQDYRTGEDRSEQAGSIADFVEEFSRDQFNPMEMHTVLWTDYMEENKPSEAFPEAMQELFTKVPEDVFKQIVGEGYRVEDAEDPYMINFHHTFGNQIPYKERGLPDSYRENFWEALPEPLKGPVNRVIFHEGLRDGAAGRPITGGVSDGGNIHEADGIQNEYLTAQELYWHSVASGGAEPEDCDTSTSECFETLDFRKEEWMKVVQHMDVMWDDQNERGWEDASGRIVQDNFYEPPRKERVGNYKGND